MYELPGISRSLHHMAAKGLTIMVGWGMLKYGVCEMFWRTWGDGGCAIFEGSRGMIFLNILLQKCMLVLWHDCTIRGSMKHFHSFNGGCKNVYAFKGGGGAMKISTITEHFNPPLPCCNCWQLSLYYSTGTASWKNSKQWLYRWHWGDCPHTNYSMIHDTCTCTNLK